jgi:hypothetical protein
VRKHLTFLALLLALAVFTVQADHFSHSVNVSALDFDGNGDWVVVADAPELRMGGGNFTLEMWINASPNAESARLMLDKGDAGRYLVATDGIGGGDRWHFNLSDGVDGINANVPGMVLDGTWHHVALVVDRDANTATAYTNGSLALVRDISVLTGDISPTSQLVFGARFNLINEYTGMLDEVRIWSVARTQDQIQSTKDRQLIGNEAGLVGYWRFNEGSGSTALDSSVNSNTGTITGAVYVDDDLPSLADSTFHNLSPEDVIQPVAGEIPAVEQRDTSERQRNLPLMDVAADVEDRTSFPFVRLILAIFAGAAIIVGAWFFSQLAPDNPVPAWAWVLVASLLALGFGALGWLSFIAIALYSSGIVAFSHRTPT